jgi:hypothetical protein
MAATATALPIRLGARGSLARRTEPVGAAPVVAHRRRARPLIAPLASAISRTAGLLPVLAPAILALAFA